MSTDFNPVYLEILRISRDLVVNEYVDRRAETHNKWLIESEHLWRTQRLRIAYPTIPPYPTEKDIIERAQFMLNFIYGKETVDQVQVAVVEELNQDQTEDGVDIEDQRSQLSDSIISHYIEQESTQGTIVKEEKVELGEIDRLIDGKNPPDTEKLSGRVLPSVLKKIEDFRKDWRKS